MDTPDHSPAAGFIIKTFASLILLATCSPAMAATAAQSACSKQWEYTVASLQSARKLASAYASADDRMTCAMAIRDKVGDLGSQPDCAQCEAEYVNILLDLGDDTSLATEKLKNPTAITRYRESEIQTRLALNNHFIESQSPQIRKYWKRNFEGLDHVLQKLQRARDFHQEVMRTDGYPLSDRSFGVWIKAIRSCVGWDFASSEKKSLMLIESTLACETECGNAAKRARQRIAEGGVTHPKIALRQIEDELPLAAIDSCPANRLTRQTP
jgi:hypothetical protein